MLFHYVLINQHSMPITEEDGLIEIGSAEEAIVLFSSQGYIVREIRQATAHDLHMEKLKKFRSELRGDKKKKIDEISPVFPKRLFQMHYFIILLMALMLFLYFLWRD